MNEEKAKAYDSKHGKDAYYYKHTKSGQAQSKAYKAYFGIEKKGGKAKSKALDKAKGTSKDVFSPNQYSDKSMKKFSSNLDRKHKQWDKEGK